MIGNLESLLNVITELRFQGHLTIDATTYTKGVRGETVMVRLNGETVGVAEGLITALEKAHANCDEGRSDPRTSQRTDDNAVSKMLKGSGISESQRHGKLRPRNL